MTLFLENFLLSLPLFLIVGLGYGFARLKLISTQVGSALSKFAFTVAIPLLLFRVMSNITHLPAPDWKIAMAFFGSCFVVFAMSRVTARRLLRLDADGQTIFAMGTVFSNNVQLGIPLTIALLGQSAMPSIALIFSLNGFLMWTLVTVAIELGRNKSPSLRKTLILGIWSTLKNPIVIGILLGTFWSLTNLEMQAPMAKTVNLLADSASPVALFAVGVGLTQYSFQANAFLSSVLAVFKLLVQPLVVYGLALAMGLEREGVQAAVLMACLPVGVNVYLMAEQFNSQQAAIANSLLLTTIIASVSTPLILSLLGLL